MANGTLLIGGKCCQCPNSFTGGDTLITKQFRGGTVYKFCSLTCFLKWVGYDEAQSVLPFEEAVH